MKSWTKHSGTNQVLIRVSRASRTSNAPREISTGMSMKREEFVVLNAGNNVQQWLFALAEDFSAWFLWRTESFSIYVVVMIVVDNFVAGRRRTGTAVDNLWGCLHSEHSYLRKRNMQKLTEESCILIESRLSCIANRSQDTRTTNHSFAIQKSADSIVQ